MVGSFLHSGRLLGAAADRGECLPADEAASGTNEHPVHPEHNAGPTIGGLAARFGAESGATPFRNEPEVNPNLHPAGLVESSEGFLASGNLLGPGNQPPGLSTQSH